MGLLQKAVETYDANCHLAGVYQDENEPLAPIGHILTRASVEITLNQDGCLISARKVDQSEPKILIPATEKSAGRSSGLAPHPLCEQLKYLAPKNKEANDLYCTQLDNWSKSAYGHSFLEQILTYVQKKTVISDLEQYGAITVDPKGSYDEKLLVCWRVNGFAGEEPACWKNAALLQAFPRFYCADLESRETALCMISGEQSAKAAQHPKGIVPANGNAKLISANDSAGFTYRGRFTEEEQAVSIGYVASQKAHNALRWLISQQGVREFAGSRVYLCWNPQGQKLPRPMRPVANTQDEPKRKPSDYRQGLQGSLMGLRRQLTGKETAVIAAFDAATTGRLAVTGYNELTVSTFLDRMEAWDGHCCWYSGAYGIQAPNLFQIVDGAFGTQQGAFLKTDDKIQRQHLQRLLDCKINGGVFPLDVLQALIQRASTPLAFEEGTWRKIMWVACAALQKYHFDTGKGGNEMDWDLDRADRSFQFGRLLAAMERAEADYYRRTQEQRQTNAIKCMPEFRRRPWMVFERLNRQLHQAYLNRVEPWQASRYERLKDEIVAHISAFPEGELNRPLSDSYLMGYELQRNAFYAKSTAAQIETEE